MRGCSVRRKESKGTLKWKGLCAWMEKWGFASYLQLKCLKFWNPITSCQAHLRPDSAELLALQSITICREGVTNTSCNRPKVRSGYVGFLFAAVRHSFLPRSLCEPPSGVRDNRICKAEQRLYESTGWSTRVRWLLVYRWDCLRYAKY